MADNARLVRGSSVPSYIISGTNALEVDQSDLRWRRSSHAVISSMLPSHKVFHSDTGLTMARTLNDRRGSTIHRKKSAAALRGIATCPDLTAHMRHLLRRISVADSMLLGEEDRMHTVASIKSMTASIAVKKQYR